MNVCPELVGPLVLPGRIPCGCGWVWNVVWCGEGLGLAHCWVLKHQALIRTGCVWGSVVLVPPFVLASFRRCRGVGGVVV